MKTITLDDGRVVYSFGAPPKSALIVSTSKHGICAEIMEEDYVMYHVQYTVKQDDGEYELISEGPIKDKEGLDKYVGMLKSIIEDSGMGWVVS